MRQRQNVSSKKGVSMRQYIIESLCEKVENAAKHTDLSENTLKKAFSKVIKKHDDVLRRLSDK